MHYTIYYNAFIEKIKQTKIIYDTVYLNHLVQIETLTMNLIYFYTI